jgi:hypothetical protein
MFLSVVPTRLWIMTASETFLISQYRVKPWFWFHCIPMELWFFSTTVSLSWNCLNQLIVLHDSEREPSSNKYYLESMVNKKILQNSNYDSSIEEFKDFKEVSHYYTQRSQRFFSFDQKEGHIWSIYEHHYIV